MPFEIICLRNKHFWSKLVTAVCGFAMVITAMAVVFPLSSSSGNDVAQYTQTTTTTTTEQEIENA